MVVGIKNKMTAIAKIISAHTISFLIKPPNLRALVLSKTKVIKPKTLNMAPKQDGIALKKTKFIPKGTKSIIVSIFILFTFL